MSIYFFSFSFVLLLVLLLLLILLVIGYSFLSIYFFIYLSTDIFIPRPHQYQYTHLTHVVFNSYTFSVFSYSLLYFFFSCLLRAYVIFQQSFISIFIATANLPNSVNMSQLLLLTFFFFFALQVYLFLFLPFPLHILDDVFLVLLISPFTPS